jgi:MraZ protein
MFAGTYYHTIDEKNRLVIPVKFREFIGSDDSKGFFITINAVGTERCIYLFTPTGWKKFIERIQHRETTFLNMQNYLRIFTANSEFVALDKQSRIVLPQKILDFAGIKKEVVLVGVFNRIEVWNKDEWHAKSETLSKEFSALQNELFKINP